MDSLSVSVEDLPSDGEPDVFSSVGGKHILIAQIRPDAIRTIGKPVLVDGKGSAKTQDPLLELEVARHEVLQSPEVLLRLPEQVDHIHLLGVVVVAFV